MENKEYLNKIQHDKVMLELYGLALLYSAKYNKPIRLAMYNVQRIASNLTANKPMGTLRKKDQKMRIIKRALTVDKIQAITDFIDGGHNAKKIFFIPSDLTFEVDRINGINQSRDFLGYSKSRVHSDLIAKYKVANKELSYQKEITDYDAIHDSIVIKEKYRNMLSTLSLDNRKYLDVIRHNWTTDSYDHKKDCTGNNQKYYVAVQRAIKEEYGKAVSLPLLFECLAR